MVGISSERDGIYLRVLNFSGCLNLQLFFDDWMMILVSSIVNRTVTYVAIIANVIKFQENVWLL